MMKILWVKAGGLLPPDTGGKIRSYNILCQLAKRHRVTLFSFYAAHEDDIHGKLDRIFERVIQIPLDLPPAKGVGEFLDYASHVFSHEPYNLTKYCRPEVRTRLQTLLREDVYDVILCDFLVAAGVIPWDFSCPKVLFTHNVEAVIWKRHYENSRSLAWKAVSWYEWKRMAAAERKYLKDADRVIAVSDRDRESFGEFINPGKVTVIQTGVDTDYFRPSSEPEIPNSLVFTGSMDWLPNEDGIVYFINEIFPLVLAKVPGATLCVVGRKPSQRLQDLAARIPNMQLTGWVEDVRPYLSKCSVCIVPLRIGGGTRLKIFEAMSMSKSVVSTSIGAEGLPVTNGEHLLLADDPTSFANCILGLFSDESMRKQIGRAARELVSQNYGWEMVARDFSSVLEDVVQSAPPRQL